MITSSAGLFIKKDSNLRIILLRKPLDVNSTAFFLRDACPRLEGLLKNRSIVSRPCYLPNAAVTALDQKEEGVAEPVCICGKISAVIEGVVIERQSRRFDAMLVSVKDIEDRHDDERQDD
jgi:hypothetical protein